MNFQVVAKNMKVEVVSSENSNSLPDVIENCVCKNVSTEEKRG